MARCLYEILQVTPKASEIEIKAAYRKLAKEFHPDRNSKIESTQKFQKLSEAYRTLIDPVTRNKYDISKGYTTGCAESCNPAWDIKMKENLESFTIELPFEQHLIWEHVCKEYYGSDILSTTNRQKEYHGLQMKFNFKFPEENEVYGTVSLTFYKTTARLLVQGMSYPLWHSEHMPILSCMVLQELDKNNEY
jgi:curved DNA-binding protein CbpA